MNRTIILRAGLRLGLFGLATIGLVSLVFALTREPIAQAEYQSLLQALNSLVPTESYDNDMVNDTRPLAATAELGLKKPAVVYRARQRGEVFAAAFPFAAPDGYNGPVNMLLAVDREGAILGVRIVSHTETPGLGDRIENRKSDWTGQFVGKSLANPDTAGWRVRKDGGEFDQFTGATITPRIIVKAVRRALLYVDAHPEEFFQ